MKSKLIKCTPQMKDGEQKKWEDNFLFTLEFEDGSKGGVMSKSQTGFEVGKEFEFDVIQKGDFSNIKIKSDFKAGAGFTPRPPVQSHLQIAWLSCLNASALYCANKEVTTKDLITLTSKLFQQYKDDTSKG